MCKNSCKVVFLDRDGTMNVEVNYLHRKEDLKLIDGTAEAVRLLNEAGYKVIVITNQAGVARGYYTEADVKILHDYMNEVLERDGAHVDAFYYCPHHYLNTNACQAQEKRPLSLAFTKINSLSLAGLQGFEP